MLGIHYHEVAVHSERQRTAVLHDTGLLPAPPLVGYLGWFPNSDVLRLRSQTTWYAILHVGYIKNVDPDSKSALISL